MAAFRVRRRRHKKLKVVDLQIKINTPGDTVAALLKEIRVLGIRYKNK